MWIETIIMPREERGPRQPPPPPRDRRAVLLAAGEESRALRDQVMGFLSAHHLLGAVKWMSEPGFLPLVTLHCTERALEKLREAAEFVVGCAAPVDAYQPLTTTEPELSSSEPVSMAVPVFARYP
ncbi:hypothetical protein HUA74_32660 [Myxococcus sp. CA051A]|uniref:Uncharacterized protein n=2 Tax=Myxococcus TaxID=32 RepID=A0A540WTC0_9BACT|nr:MULTISPECIES: hypothetical protein [Myxococcus]NTX00216.1 hypothetical protein [Myxococcus sp. CA040A]NTX15710.1 hypothetical protein [Myxococcus sp. CA056]NTX65421.1 hypothetical protein [Myxococcus sp. CA051A]NTX54100.1 hypothetical protein [Myxococcus sp. CA039A]TQF12262.1 hypothetical protein FJV41_29855 [Myxococcus llanfairpwllgwyngyllgogerychwyrndrobwllllantysiliogogogochensis]